MAPMPVHGDRLASRNNDSSGGASSWSTANIVRLLAVCAVCAVGVITIVPKPRSGGEATLSVTFKDVRVPAETVPVSLGRAIGSLAPGRRLDAQV